MKLLKFLHKWLSVIVGLQLLIWLSSGLFFSLMDHEKASGNENRRKIESSIIKNKSTFIDLTTILEKEQSIGHQVNSVKLIQLLQQPYYLINHQQGLYRHFYNEHSLISAYTGKVKVIDELMATLLATESYSGMNKIRTVIKISPPINDILGEKNTVWQVDFDDKINTSVYIDASSGRLVGHSNDNKRFVDFFFMLHFMDYGTTGGFNHGLIIFFALLTLVFTLTGFIWTIELATKGRYKL